MSSEHENKTTAVATRPAREVRIVNDDSSISYMMDTAKFEHCYRVAQLMARASLIPKHLKGGEPEQTAANCFLVVNQAIRWQLDPFAVAPETYEVGGKLGFQGKLIAAVINARAGLAEKLSYTFNDKKGDDLEVTVSGRFEHETEARTVTVSVREARTQNQMWTKDPHQKLCYTGATKWARRHKPEVILGVITDDDADRIREEERFNAAAPTEPPQFVPIEQAKVAVVEADMPKRREKKVVAEPARGPASPQMAKFNNITTPQPVNSDDPFAAEPEPPKAPEPAKPADTSFEDVVDSDAKEISELKAAMQKHDVTEAQVVAFSVKRALMKPDLEDGTALTLAHIRTDKLVPLTKNILAAGETLKKIKEGV